MDFIRRLLFASLFVAALVYTPYATAAVPPSNRWMVILNEPSALQRYPGKFKATRAVAAPYRQHLRQVQAGLRSQIEGKHIRVIGGVQHLMNGLFVHATPAQAAALRNLPGVKSVVPLRWFHRKDQLTLSNVAAAWNSAGIGGVGNAGAGLFIGVIDTGIDQNNPSFNQTLPIPTGYPISDTAADLAFTSSKVIVARSYVSYDTTSDETDTNPDFQSRPDDLTARDLIGHGTGVASVIAGMGTTVNGIPVSGVAPMAYLGNYKVFGSDEVNPGASEDGLMAALEDAVSDGVDIINMSLGGLPYTGPLDTSCDGPCDPLAYELEELIEEGYVTVVAAAGNNSNIGYQYNFNSASIPTLDTIISPAYAPSVIAAGGVQNNITYTQSVDVLGVGVPSNLQAIAAVTSYDGPDPASPVTKTLVDVTQVGDSDGLLCSPLTSSVSGDFVLVLRGTCDFSTKVAYAQTAGAQGVIFIDNGTGLSPWSVGPGAQIPAYLISQTDGSNLKSYVDANSGTSATMNPNPFQASASTQYVEDKCFPSFAPAPTEALIPESVACFASLGPIFGVGATLVKPDAAAAATDFLLAAQNYDPEGELFNFNQYAAADGTSFSTPMFSGAAALVIQSSPGFTPEQVKSALVNTASAAGLLTTDGSAAAPLVAVGAGLLQAQYAVASTVQFTPTSVYFGVLSGALPAAQSVTVINSGASSLSLNFTPSQPPGLSGTQVQVNGAASTTLTMPAASEGSLTLSLSGNVPGPGRYEGLVTATGANTPLAVPYTFIVSDGVPFDMIPFTETPPGYVAFDGPVNANLPWYSTVTCVTVNTCVMDYGAIAIQVIDRYGAPVAGYPVEWSVTGGNGSILQGVNYTDTSTDVNGLAGASVVLGSTPGPQEFTATVNGMAMPFDGTARAIPSIPPGSIVDGASFTANRAVAPGSWISVFGTNLSDVSEGAYANCPQCSAVTQPFPLGLGGDQSSAVAFTFDTPGLSLPGRFYFISSGQLNVLVPWELTGQTAASVKSIVNYTYSNLYSLPIAEYAPGFFQNPIGSNNAAAEDQNYVVVTADNPVARGSIVQLFLNGLGPVNCTAGPPSCTSANQPADGVGAPGSPLATTTTTPTITIGGQPATNIQYNGLAPYAVGLYQINVFVPTSITATGPVPITCTIGGLTATANLFVK